MEAEETAQQDSPLILLSSIPKFPPHPPHRGKGCLWKLGFLSKAEVERW